jgi:hypothetical protein
VRGVVAQEGVGLRLGDGLALAHALDVAVADGPDPGGILVSLEAAAFEALSRVSPALSNRAIFILKLNFMASTDTASTTR